MFKKVKKSISIASKHTYKDLRPSAGLEKGTVKPVLADSIVGGHPHAEVSRILYYCMYRLDNKTRHKKVRIRDLGTSTFATKNILRLKYFMANG